MNTSELRTAMSSLFADGWALGIGSASGPLWDVVRHTHTTIDTRLEYTTEPTARRALRAGYSAGLHARAAVEADIARLIVAELERARAAATGEGSR